MNPFITRLVIEVGKALGKAVIAGVGVELARVASQHVQKRFGPKDKKPAAEREMTPEELKKENERLRREVEELRAAQGGTVPPEVAEGS